MGSSRRHVATMRVGMGAVVLVATGAMAACGGGGDADGDRAASTTTSTTTTSTTPATTSTTTTEALATDPAADGTTVVARAEVDIVDVFAHEDDTEPARRLDRRQEVSGNLVFVVDELAGPGGRHHVQLPVRPNGSTGWIDADDVSVTSHRYRIEIDLGAHRLSVFEGTETVVEAPIGVGTRDTPTPGGTYYIKELLQPPDPGGPYGTYAYGLSGFSNALDSFAGGEAVIGIHGTNTPAAVGTDVSSGCIRLTNDVMDRLVEEIGLPLGVPVSISA